MEEFNEKQIATLSAFVDSEQFSTGQSNRELHLHDISAHRGRMPAGIIWPLSTEEVSHILAWAYDHHVPVTPWGAGTSTEGNPVPTRGGLHVVLVGDPDSETEGSLLKDINDQVVTRAVELGGTCTGGHGVGTGKRKFMQLKHGQGYQLMRQIKDLIDFKGLLNPGKIFL